MHSIKIRCNLAHRHIDEDCYTAPPPWPWTHSCSAHLTHSPLKLNEEHETLANTVGCDNVVTTWTRRKPSCSRCHNVIATNCVWMVYVINPFSAKFMTMVLQAYIYCVHIYASSGVNGLILWRGGCRSCSFKGLLQMFELSIYDLICILIA